MSLGKWNLECVLSKPNKRESSEAATTAPTSGQRPDPSPAKFVTCASSVHVTLNAVHRSRSYPDKDKVLVRTVKAMPGIPPSLDPIPFLTLKITRDHNHGTYTTPGKVKHGVGC